MRDCTAGLVQVHTVVKAIKHPKCSVLLIYSDQLLSSPGWKLHQQGCPTSLEMMDWDTVLLTQHGEVRDKPALGLSFVFSELAHESASFVNQILLLEVWSASLLLCSQGHCGRDMVSSVLGW